MCICWGRAEPAASPELVSALRLTTCSPPPPRKGTTALGTSRGSRPSHRPLNLEQLRSPRQQLGPADHKSLQAQARQRDGLGRWGRGGGSRQGLRHTQPLLKPRSSLGWRLCALAGQTFLTDQRSFNTAQQKQRGLTGGGYMEKQIGKLEHLTRKSLLHTLWGQQGPASPRPQPKGSVSIRPLPWLRGLEPKRSQRIPQIPLTRKTQA